nr:retrovirus-related Pol polyprotein from transposon TNT 1-94 [Tanacetum cinerariifolium]
MEILLEATSNKLMVGDADENDENVNAGDTAEGDVSAAHGEVPTVAEEPSIPSPTSPTPPPQPSHDIPSTSQVQPTTPQSPQIAQALEITKLRRRVKKLERRNKVKVLKLKRLQKVRTTQRVETSNETVTDDVSNQGRIIAEMDQDADVVLEEAKEVAKDDKVDESVDIQRRKTKSQAEIYKIDLEHANKVLSMRKDESEPAKVQEVVEVVTTAKIITEVIIAASETITAASITITAAEDQVPAATLTAAPLRVTAAPSRRRKGLVIRDPKEESTTSTIIPAETKSKYNGKGILVDEPKPLKKQQEIEQDKKYTRELEAEEDLEALWSLVKGRFSTTKPKNFSDDFLLVTLRAMFEKPDIHAQIWKTPRNEHGPAKVKGWKLLESCGVQSITFTSTQLILLVKRKYSLIRFTLDQMLNAVRLEVEKESEVSLELLRVRISHYHNCLFACFLSQQESKKVIQALADLRWIEAMQEKLLQFKLQKVWTLVDLPNGKRAIKTKWVFRNKKDERGIVVRNKARLVAQGYTQEEGIDYHEVFANVARIEATRLFLANASFKGFTVYQMDVKSAFLYGTIEEEVYVCQPPSFEDLHFPNKVYKKSLCDEFKQMMHKRFQMSSMGELTFFLGLQVKQKDDGIFISQDKYVADILKKFDFTIVKTTSTPMQPNKALIKDAEAKDVDVHLYRLMIGSLMYLTASMPNIMFAVCACARFQFTPKTSHFHAVKRIFRYLKVQPKLGIWYPRDSPFDLEAFSDSDYAGASLDRNLQQEIVNFLAKG